MPLKVAWAQGITAEALAASVSAHFAAGQGKRTATGDGDDRKKRRVASEDAVEQANNDWVQQAEAGNVAGLLFGAIDDNQVEGVQLDAAEPVVGSLSLRDIETLPELVLEQIARQLDARTLFELCLLSPVTAYKFAGIGTVTSGEGRGNAPEGFEDVPLNFGVIRGLFFSLYGLTTDHDELPDDVPFLLRKALSAELAPYLTRTVGGLGRSPESDFIFHRDNRLRMVLAWRLFRRMYLHMSAPTEEAQRDMMVLGGFYPTLAYSEDASTATGPGVGYDRIHLRRGGLAYRYFYPVDFLEMFYIAEDGSYVFGDRTEEMGVEDFDVAGVRFVSVIEMCAEQLRGLGPIAAHDPIMVPATLFPPTVPNKYSYSGTAVLDEDEKEFFEIDTDEMYNNDDGHAFLPAGTLIPGKTTLVALGKNNALLLRHVSRDKSYVDESREVNGNVDLTKDAHIQFASFDSRTKTLIVIVNGANVGEENLANVDAAIFVQPGRPVAAVYLDVVTRVERPVVSGNTIYTLRTQAASSFRYVTRTAAADTVGRGVVLEGERVPSDDQNGFNEFSRMLSVTSISANGIVTQRQFTLESPRQLVLRFSEDFNAFVLALAAYEREASFVLPLDPRFFPPQGDAPLHGVLSRTTSARSMYAEDGNTPSIPSRVFFPSNDLERYKREFKASSLRIGIEFPVERFPLPVVRVLPDEADFGVDE